MARFRALRGLTVESLRPEDVGLPREMPPYITRSHDVLLATKMVSHGFDRSRLGLLHGAVARLHDLAELPWVIEEASSSSPLSRGDVARLLLRTAEEASGIPCSTSGLLHGIAPKQTIPLLVMTDGCHRLSELNQVLYHAQGSGKTRTLVTNLVRRLNQRLGRLSRAGHVPTTTEIAHVADAAQALSALLLDLAQRLLTGCVKCFGHLVVAPPHESSPCGILRLAVPLVPRAPGAGQLPSPFKFTLAA